MRTLNFLSETSSHKRNKKRVSLRLLDYYHYHISPLFPARCKYYPTCSAYAQTAIERFGFIRGFILATLRLLRCQPWNMGGIDDVPQQFSLFYRFSWSKAHEEPSVIVDKTSNQVINKHVQG